MVNMEPTSLRRSWSSSSSCSWLLPTYEWPDPNLKTNPPKQSRYLSDNPPSLQIFGEATPWKKWQMSKKTCHFEVWSTYNEASRTKRARGGRWGRPGRGLGRGGRESRPGPRRGTRKFLNCHLSVSSSKVVLIPASQRPNKKTSGKISRFGRFSF